MLRDLFFTSRCFALTAGSSRLKEAAKRAFDALGGKPIPKVAQLSEQYAALLAEALARERGLTGLPTIAAGANGKPFFPDRPDLQFNLSHSHGAAVCALHHLPIGVDVERLRPAPPAAVTGDGRWGFFRFPQSNIMSTIQSTNFCIRMNLSLIWQIHPFVYAHHAKL